MAFTQQAALVTLFSYLNTVSNSYELALYLVNGVPVPGFINFPKLGFHRRVFSTSRSPAADPSLPVEYTGLIRKPETNHTHCKSFKVAYSLKKLVF